MTSLADRLLEKHTANTSTTLSPVRAWYEWQRDLDNPPRDELRIPMPDEVEGPVFLGYILARIQIRAAEDDAPLYIDPRDSGPNPIYQNGVAIKECPRTLVSLMGKNTIYNRASMDVIVWDELRKVVRKLSFDKVWIGGVLWDVKNNRPANQDEYPLDRSSVHAS